MALTPQQRLAGNPTLLLKESEHMGAAFFRDHSFHHFTPGFMAVGTAAMLVIFQKMLVVGRERLSFYRLVVIFMHKHRERHTRLQLGFICRPTEAESK